MYLEQTLVTPVPARKNVINNPKGRFHGWTAWTTAVRAAATIPAGVRVAFDQARYTITKVISEAIITFIFAFDEVRKLKLAS